MASAKKLVVIPAAKYELLTRQMTENKNSAVAEDSEELDNSILEQQPVDTVENPPTTEQCPDTAFEQKPVIDTQILATSDEQFPQALSSELILSVLPKYCYRKGHALLKFMQYSPEVVGWTKLGCLVTKTGCYDDTNIADLLKCAVSTKVRSPAKGWREFASVLEEINAPKHLWTNKEVLPCGIKTFDWRYIS